MAYAEFKQLSKDAYQLRKCMQLTRNVAGSLQYHAIDLEEENVSKIKGIADHICLLILDIEDSIKHLEIVAKEVLVEEEEDA